MTLYRGTKRRSRCGLALILSLPLLICGALALLLESSPFYVRPNGDVHLLLSSDSKSVPIAVDPTSMVPQKLYDLEVYRESDFQNSLGEHPPFWERNNSQSWGPCYPTTTPVSWTNQSTLHYYKGKLDSPQAYQSVYGLCRPGFLIIGQGKCGTSSLYHYLAGHPRVAPAAKKQIHYFKFNVEKPLAWYYSWFPTTESFLQSGSLMTGEASPGYMPYPAVVHQVARMLQPTSSNTSGNGNPHHAPKIIAVGRNPLERIYSSYRYNYRDPVLEYLRKGSTKVKKNQNDSYYEPYLFSLEDFVRSELDRLHDCLSGFGIEKTRSLWYQKGWARAEFDRRNEQPTGSLEAAALVDLDEVCYGDKVNRTVLRPQWAEMQMKHPEKIILSKSAYLTQAMIGRSLYVFPLEWWYILFEKKDIFFACTEELKDPDMLNELSVEFLGLPSFNFSDIVGQGAYNVGSHKGYNQATSWEDLKQEDGAGSLDHVNVPLSMELREELLEFIAPYNERLFSLVGKRCHWDSST